MYVTCIYIYIYIHIERERERERDTETYNTIMVRDNTYSHILYQLTRNVCGLAACPAAVFPLSLHYVCMYVCMHVYIYIYM